MIQNNRNFINSTDVKFGSELFDTSVAFNVQNIDLPGMYFSHPEQESQGQKSWIQGDSLTFSDLNMTILVDEDLIVWKSLVNNFLKTKDPYTGEFNPDLVGKTSWLEILNSDGETVLKLWLYGSILDNIGDLQFDMTQGEEPLLLDVVIKYDYFEIDDSTNI